MSTQAETNRTRYKSTIRLTARERAALDRHTHSGKFLVGDYGLITGVLRRVLDNAKKEAHGKGTNRGP